MKKKQLALILAVCMGASLLGGCGNSADPAETEKVIGEVTEEEPEEVVEEIPAEPVYETVSYELYVAAGNEDGTFRAYDKDEQEYTLSLADSLSEDEKALVTEGAALVISTEVEVAEEESEQAEPAPEEAESEESEEPEATAEPVDVLVTAVEAMEEEAAADLIYATFKAVNGFAVEGLADTTMYAKQTVNVRRGPSADYEQMGSLSFGQEVTVTGIADTGWYQISYNEETGYCSNNYLATEKPVAQAPSGSTSSGSSATVASAGSSTPASSGGRDYKAEYDAALAAGNIDLAMQIMAESAGRTKEEAFGSTSGGSGNSSESGSSSASVEKSVASASGFVDYLNQQREAEGLGTLSWDSSMESTAQERASEIVDDFSHNGVRNCNGEILGKLNSSSVSSWYDGFYSSSSHRAIMLGSGWNKVAAAYCKVGSTYYVVALFDF